MFNKKTWILAGGAVAIAAAGVFAHVRLQHPTTLSKLYWTVPSNISIVINSTGSDDIADGSHVTAMRQAIDEWNKISGSTLNLVENTDPAQMARADWEEDNIHLVWWDETNSSGFFGGSGIVAVTPVWFLSDGRITDADILFNGGDFNFTTSQIPGSYDVQDVGAHELGHMIGFDHSGHAGATMYPFVDPTTILHRSVSADDITGLRTVYPDGMFGSITGTVRRVTDNSVVAGAHVVAVDSNGRPAASALSDAMGDFTIGGLDADTYSVYANPLEAPVDSTNLGGGHTIETDFEATVHGATQMVTAGNATALGDLMVTADVTPVLGSTADVYPIRANQGATTGITIQGTNLVPGSTLTTDDPTMAINNVLFTTTQVSFNLVVPAMATPGHIDLIATTGGGDVSILTAPIEITPPNPTVTLVSPNSGSDAGGTALTITGTNFRAGARVIIGDTIYVDGAMGGATVVDANTITLTTAPMIGGVHDVVVVDETGVEGRDAAAFQSQSVPTIATAFPSGGNVAGGTRVVLRGSSFAIGAIVRVNGVVQSAVSVIDSTRIEFDTDAAAMGGPFDIQVENPGPAVANLAGAFTFVNQADPMIVSANPTTGGPGTRVTVSGANFTAGTQFFFGSSDDTGMGGTAALNGNFVDANTFEVDVPAVAGGSTTLMASEPGTGQAFVLPAAFTVTGSSSGGGCFVRELSARPFDPKNILIGGGWAFLVLGMLQLGLWRRRRASRVEA